MVGFLGIVVYFLKKIFLKKHEYFLLVYHVVCVPYSLGFF